MTSALNGFTGYASDISRTWPVSGRFSSAQRDVYQVVLECQLQCIAAVRAGGTQTELHQLSVQLICEGITGSISLALLSLIPHTHTHTHSLSLVLVVMMKSKELKTKISHTHSLILSLIPHTHTLTRSLSIILVVMMRSKELEISRFVHLMLTVICSSSIQVCM